MESPFGIIRISIEEIQKLKPHEYTEEPMKWGIRYRIIKTDNGYIYQPIDRATSGKDTWLPSCFVPLNTHQ